MSKRPPSLRRKNKSDRLIHPDATANDSHYLLNEIEMKRAERRYQRQSALTINRPSGGPKMADSQRICSIDGCDNPVHQRGWCNRHYLRWYRNGHPLSGRVADGEPMAWLMEAIKAPPSKCLLWPFAAQDEKYGKVWFGGKMRNANRVALILHTGLDPRGMDAAHSCHNKRCVNPAHLSWETRQVNMQQARDQGWNGVKLNKDAAREIKASEESLDTLSERHGVSRGTVEKIRYGKAWIDA